MALRGSVGLIAEPLATPSANTRHRKPCALSTSCHPPTWRSKSHRSFNMPWRQNHRNFGTSTRGQRCYRSRRRCTCRPLHRTRRLCGGIARRARSHLGSSAARCCPGPKSLGYRDKPGVSLSIPHAWTGAARERLMAVIAAHLLIRHIIKATHAVASSRLT